MMSFFAVQPGLEFRFVLTQVKLLDLSLTRHGCGKVLQARGGQAAPLGNPGAQVSKELGVLPCCWLGSCQAESSHGTWAVDKPVAALHSLGTKMGWAGNGRVWDHCCNKMKGEEPSECPGV